MYEFVCVCTQPLSYKNKANLLNMVAHRLDHATPKLRSCVRDPPFATCAVLSRLNDIRNSKTF